jgi:rubredoxin
MARYRCLICQYVYNEKTEGIPFDDLPPDWTCPVCGAAKSEFEEIEEEPQPPASAPPEIIREGKTLEEFRRASDDIETLMADIHRMAATGESVIEPMRSRKPSVSWDDILIKGAQLARFPLNRDEPVDTRTVIGPKAKKPLVIGTPIIISHMSFGALSKEAQTTLALGSGAVGTAMCSGEGGILAEALGMAHSYILEYVPNRYSITEENLGRVDAVEIKFGQSAKPGMGGHLPAGKVTAEIAALRGFPTSPRATTSSARSPSSAGFRGAGRSGSSSPPATSRPTSSSPSTPDRTSSPSTAGPGRPAPRSSSSRTRPPFPPSTPSTAPGSTSTGRGSRA